MKTVSSPPEDTANPAASTDASEQGGPCSLEALCFSGDEALVAGVPYGIPKDLFIPEDAWRVGLERFEGPMDLLLYLIKRHRMDIADIPVREITRQYLLYLELMKRIHLELAAEYLVMAAVLTEIKSRMMMPRPQKTSEALPQEDPRLELARRLKEYERFKQAAMLLDAYPRNERDYIPVELPPDSVVFQKPLPVVSANDLVFHLKKVTLREKRLKHHAVLRDPLTLAQCMARVLQGVLDRRPVYFFSCVDAREGRVGLVLTFMAILELAKQRKILLEQRAFSEPIVLRAVTEEGPSDVHICEQPALSPDSGMRGDADE